MPVIRSACLCLRMPAYAGIKDMRGESSSIFGENT
jgi:hypothetical protein